ncbi:MAG: septum formation protein Maf [Atopobiaceae bacterium]|nr:septum formation protein Maf [Atopobiaceae bacterium]
MILASASPRRRELLEELGFKLEIVPADIDETRLEGEHPRDLVQRLAHEKAWHVLKTHGFGSDGFLLAADTIVWMGEEALGKPADNEDACHMLRELSGKTHHVSTGVSLLYGSGDGSDTREASFVETTDVSFHELTEAQIVAYVRSGECADKAGAYAIQGTGRLLVSGIRGDYPNVVGLPVCRVVREMALLSAKDGEQDIVEKLLEVAHA